MKAVISKALSGNITIKPSDLIMPVFVTSGSNITRSIPSLPGQFIYSPDQLTKIIKKLVSLGIKSIILFEICSEKDELGSYAFSDKSCLTESIKLIKKTASEILIISDLCLCQYCTHAHCGILNNSQLDNDTTLQQLTELALIQARAGTDVIMPSSMTDGVIQSIRIALDENNFYNLPIMGQSAKFSSAFFNPFRNAASSNLGLNNKHSYQIGAGNIEQALREIEADITEGADIVMVKPALGYLDVIQASREKFNVPLAAFCTSGEYGMMLSEMSGDYAVFDHEAVFAESLISLKRAGANLIVTYRAIEVAESLNNANKRIQLQTPAIF